MPALSIAPTGTQPITAQAIAQNIRDHFSQSVTYLGKPCKLLSDSDLNRLEQHIQTTFETAASHFETAFAPDQPWTCLDSLTGRATLTLSLLPGNHLSCSGLTQFYYSVFRTNLKTALFTWMPCSSRKNSPLFHLPQELPNANALYGAILAAVADPKR